MIKQFLFACIIGCLGTIYYLQHDQWFKRLVADRICSQLSIALDCIITDYKVTDLYIFTGSITLNDVTVTARNTAQWYWSAKTFRLSFSWIELLLYGTIDLTIYLADLIMESAYDGSLAIKPHLYTSFFANTLSLPVILKQFSLQRAYFRAHDKHNQTCFILDYSCQLKKINNALKAIVRINNGESTYNERILFKQLYGTIELNASSVETQPHVIVNGSCSAQIPYLDAHHTQCHIAGNWHDNQGSLSIKNSNNSFDINTRVHNSDIIITANTPLSSIYRLIYNTNDRSWLTGSCQLHAKGDIKKTQLHGHILFKEIAAASTPIGSLGRVTFDKLHNAWSGTMYGQRKSGIACSGSWQFNEETGNGTIRVVNDTALYITPSSQWSIPAHDSELRGYFNNNGYVQGKFRCNAQHAKLRSTVQTEGTIIGNKKALAIKGQLGSNTYQAEIATHPHVYLTSCQYNDSQKKSLINLHANNKNHHAVMGKIDFGCIREALNLFYSYDLQGEGQFDTHIIKQKNGLEFSMKLVNGTIRLPQTYNFINKFCTKLIINWASQQLIIKDLQCQLHKGSLYSKRAIVQYTDDGLLSFAHVPLFFQNCLLNIQKDLFAIVSGRLFFNQPLYDTPRLQGMVIFDSSQLNENLFSHTVHHSLIHNAKNMFISSTADMNLDIDVLTAHPVRVKTPFLETDAQLRIAISNTLHHPNLVGHINLNSGELSFPYKPLYISKGSIYFMPNQLYDPMIELEARNTIKKFNINMHVTGSVQNHNISLSSSPPLSEEQIVALLLVGSQEESLNIVMPALLIQNIKQLLFGSEQTRTRIERYFTGFLKPFKHITLVPSFVDQTGRGGLRGAVEINVHERLRALIQKNFSLTEDTRFEVEYMLSDDISLRGVRDERRDISGELEMRWKF